MEESKLMMKNETTSGPAFGIYTLTVAKIAIRGQIGVPMLLLLAYLDLSPISGGCAWLSHAKSASMAIWMSHSEAVGREWIRDCFSTSNATGFVKKIESNHKCKVLAELYQGFQDRSEPYVCLP